MYVTLVGPAGKKSVTVREDYRDLITGKKKSRVIKTYGPLKKLEEKDPDFLVKLKKQMKEETESLKEGKAVQVTLSCEKVIKAEDGFKMLNIGHVIVDRIWQLLNLDTFIMKNVDKRNAKRIRDNMYYLVSHRLSTPSSVLGANHDASSYAGMGDIALDVLYKVLNEFDELTDKLIDHLGEQFQKKTTRNMDHVCYDVTNYYFESTDAGELRLFGYSKEHKNNEVIVVMGLLVDSNGIPIAFKLFPGNTMDQNTLSDSVLDLKKRYGFKEVTVVADRGMNSGDNLVFLSNEGHHFVISYTLKKASASFKEDCLNEDTWQVTRFDSNGELVFASKIIQGTQVARIPITENELIKLKEERQDKKLKGRMPKYKDVIIPVNVHVTYSKARALKDENDRERSIEKLEKRIKSGKVESSLKYGCNRYLDIEIKKTGKYVIDQAKVAEEAKYDGFYAIVTDRLDLTSDEVCVIYKDQWKIEESFRILKTDLQARPVYVRVDPRVRGHFCLCYLSLCIIRYMQYLYTEKKKETISAERIMTAIEDSKVILLGDEKKPLLGTHVTNDFIRLCEAFDVPYLEKTMTVTRFKALTGFDIKMDIAKLIGQFKIS